MNRTPLSSPLEQTVAVVGVGLIGGSLAAAMKQQGVAERVIGVGRGPERLQAALAAGLIDGYETDLKVAAKHASLVVVCTPVDRIVQDVRTAAAVMSAGSLITDAGSTKANICRELADLSRGPVTFVGSHPLAGSEKSGFEAASATLFQDRTCVITPLPSTPVEAVQRLHRLWAAVGMRTCELSPDEHDTALAMTSHLPHAVAAALALTLPEKYRHLTASGFRDTTRIAAGDADLWTAIFQHNAEPVVAALQSCQSHLEAMTDAIRRRDAASLQKLLQQAKTNRTALDAESAC